MSNRIEGGGRAEVCEWSPEDDTEERACHEPPEIARARSDREAQMRSERWARGEDERGMSTKQGTSQLSPTPQTSEGLDADEQRRVDSDNRKRLERTDKPLEDDPVGNAIPGMLAGGIAGALEAAAGGAGARGVGGAVAGHVLADIEADALTAHATHGTHAGHDAHPAPHAAPPHTTAKPTQSAPPPVIGPDRSPYAPGTAPVRIPELPVVIQG